MHVTEVYQNLCRTLWIEIDISLRGFEDAKCNSPDAFYYCCCCRAIMYHIKHPVITALTYTGDWEKWAIIREATLKMRKKIGYFSFA